MRARVVGDGPAVLLLPSLGRGGSDFEDLVARLAGAGYRCVVLDPPGVDGVEPPRPVHTLHDLADMVAEVATPHGPAHVIGHAFGGRVARCLSADRPELVRSLVVLGGGGRVRGDPAALAALRRCFDLDLPPEAHLASVATAFFAPGNDPTSWARGWWPRAQAIESRASGATPVEEWWTAGSTVPILVIVGSEDRIAPPANARLLVEERPTRVSLIEVAGAGHALLPERPVEVAHAVVRFFRAQDVDDGPTDR